MRFLASLTRKKEENQGCKKEKHRKTVLRYDRFYCIPQMRYIGWRGDHIVISMNCIPSGKQVRRAREKRLITVFREAMSRIASRSRRVYRADDMRHKSGRGMRCAGQKLGYGFKVCTDLLVYLRTTAIPRCALHTRYTNPLHEKYSCKSARIFTCKWVRFCAEHKKRDRHHKRVSVSFLG